MNGLADVGDNHAQVFNDSVDSGTFLDDNENRIVACYGADDVGTVAVVNIVGYTAGIARTGLDHTHVARKTDRQEPGDQGVRSL